MPVYNYNIRDKPGVLFGKTLGYQQREESETVSRGSLSIGIGKGDLDMCSMGRVGTLNRTGMEACRRGEFDEAEARLLTALGLVQAGTGNCTAIKLHNNLGIVYELKGYPGQAAEHYGKALELMRARKAASHPLYTRITRGLSRAFVNAGIPDFPPSGK